MGQVMEKKEIVVKIDTTILDVYGEMLGDMYSDELKDTFAYKLLKMEFEKKIVEAVMKSYNNQEQ